MANMSVGTFVGSLVVFPSHPVSHGEAFRWRIQLHLRGFAAKSANLGMRGILAVNRRVVGLSSA